MESSHKCPTQENVIGYNFFSVRYYLTRILYKKREVELGLSVGCSHIIFKKRGEK